MSTIPSIAQILAHDPPFLYATPPTPTVSPPQAQPVLSDCLFVCLRLECALLQFSQLSAFIVFAVSAARLQ